MALNRRSILRAASVIGGTGLGVSLAGCTGSGPTDRTTDQPAGTPTPEPTATATAASTATGTPSSGRLAGTPTVAAATHPEHGVFLTDSEGMTLYLFENDEGDTSTCYDGCAEAWPPLLVEEAADLSAPAGVPGELGTTEREDGALQVTYDGVPLYYFVKDEQPGDATGQGVNDVWFVVRLTDDAAAPTLDERTHPEHGSILTDGEGMTLYLFENDEDGESVCYDSCAEAWPPLTVDRAPVVTADLRGDVGTTEREDGSLQVTYEGVPLYYFVKDEQPGDATGQGINDVWFVISPDGARQDSPSVSVTTHPEHGAILTDGEGMTLYLFENDEDGESVCYDSCAEAWPPLTVDDTVVVPRGLPNSAGATEREDGSLQITYGGMPLYYFVKDEQPGDATGEGVNDVWFVVPPTDAAASNAEEGY